MSRRFPIVFLLLYVSISFTFSQGRNTARENTAGRILTIYSDDDPAYFLPLIEQKLGALKNATTDSAIFDKVVNISRLKDSQHAEDVLNQFFIRLADPSKIRSDNSFYRKKIDEIGKLVTASTYFLKIEINELGPNLEYQMELYNTVNIKEAYQKKGQYVEKMGLPIIDVLEPSRFVNVFFEPSKESFQYDIDDALKKLFPETNIPPELVIKTNSLAERSDSVAYSSYYDKYFRVFEVGQIINVSAESSYDKDTPKDKLTYSWRNPSNEIDTLVRYLGNSTKLHFPFSYGQAVQTIQANQPGYYVLEVSVSDGVEQVTRPVVLVVMNKPKLRFADGDTLKRESYSAYERTITTLRKRIDFVRPENPYDTRRPYDLYFLVEDEFGRERLHDQTRSSKPSVRRYPLQFPLQFDPYEIKEKSVKNYKITLITHGVRSNPIHLEVKTKSHSPNLFGINYQIDDFRFEQDIENRIASAGISYTFHYRSGSDEAPSPWFSMFELNLQTNDRFKAGNDFMFSETLPDSTLVAVPGRLNYNSFGGTYKLMHMEFIEEDYLFKKIDIQPYLSGFLGLSIDYFRPDEQFYSNLGDLYGVNREKSLLDGVLYGTFRYGLGAGFSINQRIFLEWRVGGIYGRADNLEELGAIGKPKLRGSHQNFTLIGRF